MPYYSVFCKSRKVQNLETRRFTGSATTKTSAASRRRPLSDGKSRIWRVRWK
jgi:hypothetical protein